MKYETLVVGPIETNCYVIWDEDTLEGAVIDPGGDFDEISLAIEENKLNIKYILLTHAHFDHTYACGTLSEKYGAEVVLHAADNYLINDDLGIMCLFGNEKYIPYSVDITPNDGDVITLGNSKTEVLHTPGHSKGGVCYVCDCGVFVGDTIFASSVGRSDLAGGNHDELISSINTKIMVMKDETPLFPGHGFNTTVGIERTRNPFL